MQSFIKTYWKKIWSHKKVNNASQPQHYNSRSRIQNNNMKWENAQMAHFVFDSPIRIQTVNNLQKKVQIINCQHIFCNVNKDFLIIFWHQCLYSKWIMMLRLWYSVFLQDHLFQKIPNGMKFVNFVLLIIYLSPLKLKPI